jgi:hypothetical protein
MIAGRPVAGSLVAGVGALLVLGGLGAYATVRGGSLAPLAGATALGGVVLAGLALAGFVNLLPWALALVAAGYVVIDLARSLPLAAAPFYGAGLLLAAELVYAARELAVVPEERPRRRVRWLAGVAVAALGVAYVPVAAAGAHALSGAAAELVALVAVSVVAAIPAALARRRAHHVEPTTSG